MRIRGEDDSGRVATVELFFDLVFVFAVTQLSHTLLAQLTAAGALQVGILLLAIWWAWIYTAWVTNWLDPRRSQVRIALFVLMLAGVVMSASIPEAFAGRGWVFAVSYVFIQVGRTLFFLWAVRGEPVLTRNFQRILVWFALSAVLWLVGGFAESGERLTFWALALALELASPAIYYRVPGLGRSRTDEWNVDPHHMAERCGLFIIIALGESLLITGAAFAELEWNAPTTAGFLIAVLGSVAMWWLYFDTGAERAHHRMSRSADPGRQARSAYTYLHVPIVAGIIVCAVADEIVLMHPKHATNAGIVVILGGPALYLLGSALFKWITNDRSAPPLSHLVGLVLVSALAPPALEHAFSALELGALTSGILVLVAGWESIAIRRSATGEAVRIE